MLLSTKKCWNQITLNGREKLSKGIRLSKDILTRAGITEKTIRLSQIQEVLPGGTATIGK